MLRKMVKGGFKIKTDRYSYVLTNSNIYSVCKTIPLDLFIAGEQRLFIAHIILHDDSPLTKRLHFNNEASRFPGRMRTLESMVEKESINEREFIERSTRKEY